MGAISLAFAFSVLTRFVFSCVWVCVSFILLVRSFIHFRCSLASLLLWLYPNVPLYWQMKSSTLNPIVILSHKLLMNLSVLHIWMVTLKTIGHFFGIYYYYYYGLYCCSFFFIYLVMCRGFSSATSTNSQHGVLHFYWIHWN